MQRLAPNDLRAALTLLACSTMIMLAGTHYASAFTPPPAAASAESLPHTGHGLILAQATQGTKEEQQKFIEEMKQGIEQQEAGITAEEKALQAQKQGLAEQLKALEEQERWSEQHE
jgi:uncharacterized FlgJ-related protein